ncbi:MAG: LysM peptidoglycan-binding domain-containing protein [Spirochaetales bacterium]|nr:LysM peptidoglycan-binding domain-containing protein [Leptospiraceae bacterium]MCP5483494.1 LysM peptidoglycan-binding domain-containing protein [Spirochaetales bacterium]MCP5486754.1 LysM peptidoglycan-binding domain-containing protein [Spirochaetales bacterium]
MRVRDGYRPIEELRNGDEVLAFNEETGRLEYRTITEVFVHTVHELYEVSYDDGTVVESTWNHPFLIEGRGWVEAKDLHAFDRSHTAESARNGSENRAALSHGVSSKARFGGLADLRVREAGTALIRSVRHVRRTTQVYNIHLDGAHTYFVTKADVLVHNYRVESGDTLNALAARFQVSRADLLQANPWLADNPDLIRAGEVLLIPGRDDALIAEVEAETERLYEERVAEIQARHPFSKALMDENGRVFGFIGRDGGNTYLYSVDGRRIILDEAAVDRLGFETAALLSLGGASAIVGPLAVARFVGGAVAVQVAGDVAESQGVDRRYVDVALILAFGARALLRRTAAARVVAENARRAPVLPPYEGGKTTGVFRASGFVDEPLVSGYSGPAARQPLGTPGMNNNLRAHVEGHTAALMRQRGLQEGTLYINRVPCAGVRGCDAMLPRMLPPGARLRVIGPDGYERVFVGLPD